MIENTHALEETEEEKARSEVYKLNRMLLSLQSETAAYGNDDDDGDDGYDGYDGMEIPGFLGKNATPAEIAACRGRISAINSLYNAVSY